MPRRRRLTRSAAIILLAFTASACAVALAAATMLFPGDAGNVPPGLVLATATPDTSRAIPSDQALAAIARRSPATSELVKAITAHDVELLGSQLHSVNKACTPPGERGITIACAGGTENRPMIDIGEHVPFWIDVDLVREYIARVFRESSSGVQLTYAAESEADGQRLFLGLESDARIPGEPPLAAVDVTMSGIFLVIDARSTQPVTAVRVLTTTWDARQQGQAFAELEPVRIIAYSSVNQE